MKNKKLARLNWLLQIYYSEKSVFDSDKSVENLSGVLVSWIFFILLVNFSVYASLKIDLI